MIPVSECKRRSRNECPCPACNGAIPLALVGDELTVEATHSLLSSEMSTELFIMLAHERVSQGSSRSSFLVAFQMNRELIGNH